MQSILDIMCAKYGFSDQQRSCFAGFSNETLANALQQRRNARGIIRSNFDWLQSKCKAIERSLETTKHVGLIAAFGHKDKEKKLNTKIQKYDFIEDLEKRLQEIEDPIELEKKLFASIKSDAFDKFPDWLQKLHVQKYQDMIADSNLKLKESCEVRNVKKTRFEGEW